MWDTIGTEYLDIIEKNKDRMNINFNEVVVNYMLNASDKLLPEFMRCVIIINKNDLDFTELRESGLKTLATCVECGNKSVVDTITNGISIIINSTNSGERQASALLFSALCQYSDKAYIETCLRLGFDHLYALIRDNEFIVRKNTLNGFVAFS